MFSKKLSAAEVSESVYMRERVKYIGSDSFKFINGYLIVEHHSTRKMDGKFTVLCYSKLPFLEIQITFSAGTWMSFQLDVFVNLWKTFNKH